MGERREKVFVSFTLEEAEAVTKSLRRTMIDMPFVMSSEEVEMFDKLAGALTKLAEEIREAEDYNAKIEAEF